METRRLVVLLTACLSAEIVCLVRIARRRRAVTVHPQDEIGAVAGADGVVGGRDVPVGFDEQRREYRGARFPANVSPAVRRHWLRRCETDRSKVEDSGVDPGWLADVQRPPRLPP